MKSSKQPAFFYGYKIVIFGFLIFMIQIGAQYCFGVFFKPVLNDFGWTRAVTTGAYSLTGVFAAFWGIAAGRIVDRFGPRKVISVCAVIFGLSYILMSGISTVWQFYLYYGVLMSMAMVAISISILSSVARWFYKRRGLANGIVMSGIGLGTIIMPPLANKLITTYDWRNSFLIIGVAALVIILIAGQFIRRDPAQMGLQAYGVSADKIEAAASVKISGFTLREAVCTRQFWLISVGYFAYAFCLNMVMVHIVPHATDIGITAASAAGIISVIGIVSMVGKIGLGGAGDKLGNKRIMLIVFVLLTGAFLLVLRAGELWTFYIFAVIFGAGYGGFAAILSPAVAEYFGLKEHGVIFGTLNGFTGLGQAVGPLVAGRIFDVTGNYNWAFILCILLSVISFAVVWQVKPVRRKETLLADGKS